MNSVVCFQQVAAISTHFGVSSRIAESPDARDGGFGLSGGGHFHSISRGRLIAIRGGVDGASRGSTDEICGVFHLARLCIQEGRKTGGSEAPSPTKAPLAVNFCLEVKCLTSKLHG